MKILALIIITISSLQVNAYDMSKTENYKQAFKELPDGTSQYIGKCSTHQDYEGTYFQVTKTLVEYFEPSRDSSENELSNKLNKIENQLILATLNHIKFESFNDVDDLTIEKIKSTKFQKLDLYRLNIGVGGGNGMYLVYNRVNLNGKIEYKLMSDIFDGDIEYCDNKIWL